MEQGLLSSFLTEMLLPTTVLVLKLYPIWLPLFLGLLFWHVWFKYVQSKFFLSQETILLEISVPKEVAKSPLAMELFLVSLNQTGGESTFIDKFIKGKTRPWFSLELASHGGDVRFYIWTRKAWKGFIESQLYAQYPEAEISEVEDYAKEVVFEKGKVKIWGTDIVLAKDDAYPIKTYVDYGLDKESKEELRIDPITPMIEYLGSIKPGESVWVQIIIQGHKDRKNSKAVFAKTDWQKEAKEVVKDLISKNKAEETGASKLTKGQNEIISAIERSITKPGFDCGIRVLYISNSELFNPVNISGLVGSFKQYGDGSLNAFKPNGYLAGYDYPWNDMWEIKQNKDREDVLRAYKLRSYFYYPYKSKYYVLNTEELATIFHFPGQVAQTPTMKRLDSRRAAPPSNLPV